MRTAKALLHLAAALPFALLGCAGDDDARPGQRDGGLGADGGPAPGGPPTPKVEATVEPFPFTTQLSKTAARALSAVEDDGTLVFEGGGGELDALEPDTIVIVPASESAPTGLLRRIDGVERDGERVTLRTRQASVLHAFRKVDISVEVGGPADAASLPTIGSALFIDVDSSDHYPFAHDVDWVVFDGDKNASTTEDRVLVSGEMQASVGYEFHLEFDWGLLQDIIDCLEDPDLSCIEALDPFQAAAGIDFELRFVADLKAGADLNVSGAAALSFEREIELAEPQLLGVIEAGPFLITPRLAATAGIAGGATAKLDVDVEVSGGVEFGIAAKGTSVWPVGKGPYLDTPSGSATIQNTAHARAWVNPRIELLLYDVVGPTIGLEPWSVVDADTERDPCWKLTGGLDATLGIHLGVGPVTLINEYENVPLTSKEFASGECPLPGGPGGGSLDPTFDPWAEKVGGPLYSAGTIDDSTSVAYTPGGGFIYSANTASGLLVTDPLGKPLFVREYVRDQLETLYAERAVALLDTSLLIVGRRGAVLRVDEAGALISAQVLDVADDPNTHVGAMVRTDQGGAWVAGHTPQASGDDDGWVARFAPDGSLLDAFAIRGPLDERPRAIVLLDDGGALIAGESFDAGANRAWAARVQQDGTATFFARLRDCELEAGLGEDSIVVRGAALTHDGNFALAGYTFYPDYRGMLVKLWKDGSGLAWGRTYDSSEGLGLQLDAVSALESGGFLVGGTQVDIGPNDAIALAETDSAGNVAWLQRYDTEGRDGQVSLLRTVADNGVVVAATSGDLDTGKASALLLKVPRKNGEITFASASAAVASSMAVSDAGVCLDLEPYAGGVIEPLPAALEALPLVVAEEIAAARTPL